MKNINLFLLACFLCLATYGQCDFKTSHRTDGNTIKYFNPKPVIRQSDYEIGASIYKNTTTNLLMVNISVLFKGRKPGKLTGNLIIQTINHNGISLKPLLSDIVEMNGRDVAIGLYEIDSSTIIELSKFPLKSIFVKINENLIGATVAENTIILKTEINCLL